MKCITLLSVLLPLTTALWPIPSSYSHGKDVLWIEKSVRITFKTPYSERADVIGAPMSFLESLKGRFLAFTSLRGRDTSEAVSAEIVDIAVDRMRKAVFEQSYVPWMFYPRGTEFEPSGTDKKYVKSIDLEQTEKEPKNILKPKAGEIDESYSIDMSNDGAVVIKAPSAIGLAHGLTTFSQFFYATASGDGHYTELAPVMIKDSPKFAHRGLNLDTSRTYKPVPVVKKTIDALAMNKLNRLHMHITDAQAWPLVISSMPSLSSKGAYKSDMVYTPEQVKEIQRYGALRGVEVYLEIDMPGHTSSIAYAYPDLIAAFNVQPDWVEYAAEPPSGTLKLNSSAVYTFLDKMWTDLLPRLLPYTSYFHTGGDEVKYNAYTLDNTVKSNQSSVIEPLLQKFTNHNHKRIRDEGLTPMVWEEMLLEYNITLGKDVIVQTWQSDEAVRQTVEKGYRAIAGNYNYWYLDCGKGQWLDFRPGKDALTAFPYLDYCQPYKNWRLVYSYDPLGSVPSHLQHLVLGGETHIWSEQTDSVNLDRMVWPRASAAAEVLWSGAKNSKGQNRSQITASPRLSDMRERLLAMGVEAEPVRMPFCSMGKEQCVSS